MSNHFLKLHVTHNSSPTFMHNLICNPTSPITQHKHSKHNNTSQRTLLETSHNLHRSSGLVFPTRVAFTDTHLSIREPRPRVFPKQREPVPAQWRASGLPGIPACSGSSLLLGNPHSHNHAHSLAQQVSAVRTLRLPGVRIQDPGYAVRPQSGPGTLRGLPQSGTSHSTHTTWEPTLCHSHHVHSHKHSLNCIHSSKHSSTHSCIQAITHAFTQALKHPLVRTFEHQLKHLSKQAHTQANIQTSTFKQMLKQLAQTLEHTFQHSLNRALKQSRKHSVIHSNKHSSYSSNYSITQASKHALNHSHMHSFGHVT